MKRFSTSCILFLVLFILPSISCAGRLQVFIEPFSAAGASGQQVPAALQNLLGSRLDSKTLQVLDQPAGAQVLITGTYTQLGKAFSLDVTARTPSGVVITKAFEQGQGQEEVLTALTKLGEKLSALLPASDPQVTRHKTTGEGVARVDEEVAPSSKSPGEIIKTEGGAKDKERATVGQRLTGIYTGMAQLRMLEEGDRELVLLQERRLQVVRHGKKTVVLDEVVLGQNEKALAVDTADLDGDGQSEIYVTVMQEERLVSQVWAFKNQHLVKAADKLPYYFRVLADTDGGRTVYAQQMGLNEDFYGPVFKVKQGPKGYDFQSPLKLPRFGNIFNFNRFTDSDGKPLLVVIHPEGFLLVFAESGEELWRSNEKYGGSEVYLSRNDLQNMQYTGSASRKVFLEQRLTVRKNGEIVVPENTGIWVVGNSRSYSKNSVHAFIWTGVALDERWHTKVSQNYLADYYLDELRNELVLLEVVKKEGLIEKGTSAITIKKID